jgi:pyroglutamyl-peptidase
MADKLILATGFEPFPSAPLNPTAWLIEQLKAGGWAPEGVRLEARVLPTTYDVCETTLMPLLDELKPDAVVQFGLSAKAMGFTLERTAINTQHTSKPDSAGRFAVTPWIDPMAPGTRGSSLPLNDIAVALEAAGLPWDFSDHAGQYMCNLVFFRTRLALPGLMTGFVHVPYTAPMQAEIIATGAPVPEGVPLEEADLLRGAKLVVDAVAARLRAPAAMV